MNKIQSFDDAAAISPRAVRDQLRRILDSAIFARSNRMQRFLAYIVEETLAGRKDELGEYGLGVTVYDRGTDFEPMLDPIVRNDARRLRFKLLEYYRNTQQTDEIVIDMPKGGYVPVFSVIGSKRGATPLPANTRRIAVLPFEVLSDTPDSGMAVRALGLSMTAGLSNLSEIEAVAHGYLRQMPSPAQASEIGLSHVVQGSLLTLGGRCRVIVNLISSNDGVQLWAREFDFESISGLTFQSEITRTVASEVTAQLRSTNHRGIHLAAA